MTNPFSRRTFTVGVAAGAAVAALPRAAEATTRTTEPFFDEVTLWDSAVGPLANYHVHGLCVLPDDTILAATEGRHDVCDAGPHDILLRRSTDKGATWEPSTAVVSSVDDQCWSNPTFGVTVLRADGAVTPGPTGELYREYATDQSRKPERLTLIPYYAWANRGQHAMRVWIPT